MSLFQCRICGCRENTSGRCSNYWVNKGDKICSACDPKINKWHENFPRMFLPIGMFITNNQGNLENKYNGDTDESKYEIKNGSNT